MRLGELALLEDKAFARRIGRRDVCRHLGRARPEHLLHVAHELVMVHVAGRGDDQVRWLVGMPPESADVVVGQAPDAVLVAGDLPAQRRVAEEGPVEQVEDVLARVVAVRANLLDDDVALARDVRAAQQRPHGQLCQHLEGTLRLARRDARPVHRRLTVSGRVARATVTLDRLGHGARRREGLRALEGDVLHEVSDARLLAAFEARAGEDVHRGRHGPAARHARRDHARAIGDLRPIKHHGKGLSTAGMLRDGNELPGLVQPGPA